MIVTRVTQATRVTVAVKVGADQPDNNNNNNNFIFTFRKINWQQNKGSITEKWFMDV